MKLVIIPAVVGVVMLAAGAGAGMYFAAQRTPHAPAAPQDTHHAIYFAAIEPIVVNLSNGPDAALAGGSNTYLQIGFQLESDNAQVVTEFKDLNPAIRGKVIALMLDAPVAIMQSAKVRDTIKAEVLADVNDIIYANDATLGQHAFQRVYITDFVTQPE